MHLQGIDDSLVERLVLARQIWREPHDLGILELKMFHGSLIGREVIHQKDDLPVGDTPSYASRTKGATPS